MSSETTAPEEAGVSVPAPRENIIRAVLPGVELRSTEDGTRTLAGHFAVFNEWTEINSAWEGRFLERIAPGAFKKTFSENRNGMKVLFDHGHDPSIGNKPLGPIRSLAEDERGASYEVELLDTSYVRELIPGLEAGLYGASFRFKVMREDINDDPDESEWNPRRLPERTIREAKVAEFGPVAFPAYAGATAGVRSLTDEYILHRFLTQPDRLRELLTNFLPTAAEEAVGEVVAPTIESAETESHPAVVRRASRDLFGSTREEKPAWLL